MKNNFNSKSEIQFHRISPIYDENSKILILGSFPSVKSREVNFYYGHPQNRFWKVMACVCGCEFPQTERDKKSLLFSNSIALWDVVAECRIRGSSDVSISDTVPNDIELLLKSTKIKKIFLNGKTAQKLYDKHFGGKFDIEVQTLPSTSPANASYTFRRLVSEWSKIKY